jgi:DNA-binding FadR family transcriptional regulator
VNHAEAITYYNQRAEEFRRKAEAQPEHRDHYLACAAAEQEAANDLMRGEVQYAQSLPFKPQ